MWLFVRILQLAMQTVLDVAKLYSLTEWVEPFDKARLRKQTHTVSWHGLARPPWQALAWTGLAL